VKPARTKCWALLGLGGEHGKGILMLSRTCAVLGRAKDPLPGNLHPGEAAIEKSRDCPCHDVLLTQW